MDTDLPNFEFFTSLYLAAASFKALPHSLKAVLGGVTEMGSQEVESQEVERNTTTGVGV